MATPQTHAKSPCYHHKVARLKFELLAYLVGDSATHYRNLLLSINHKHKHRQYFPGGREMESQTATNTKTQQNENI